jgi:alkylation response protein AidB-like acyl-CoA dehydrogenase
VTAQHLGVSEEQQALREVVREFVDRRVIPTACERERRDEYPADLVAGLADLGVMGMSIPEEYGGSELDLISYALVFEELARGWMGLASVVGSSSSGAWLISRYGTAEQKARYLPDLAVGRATSGIAISEPSTGSDVKAIRTHAQHRGDKYIVNGDKTMITHARHAVPLVVLVRTDTTVEAPHRGMSLLLVELDTPGYHIDRDLTKLGHKGVELCELRFDQAEVPEANLLGGEPGQGFHQMMSALDRGRIYIAGAATGIARAAMESATHYAKQRQAFGNPIATYQAVKLKLAKMAMQVEASRLLTLNAAHLMGCRGRASAEAAMAKVFASETAIDSALEAMRTLGGYGYTTEFPVERFYRDAPLMAIGEGTNEILQLLIADELTNSTT